MTITKREKTGRQYFVYDNPEYQGAISAQAAGWFVQGWLVFDADGSCRYEAEPVRRVEGLCDPAYKARRIPPGSLANAPPAVFTGTCPKPDDYQPC